VVLLASSNRTWFSLVVHPEERKESEH